MAVPGKPEDFLALGWCRFPRDAALLRWTRHALPPARAAIRSPDNAGWLRCGGTWFVGVNALPNDAEGRVGGSPPLPGPAVDFIRRGLGMPGLPWDRAQISVCYPGYPGQEEDAASFRYRLSRDGAHVDGLHPVGSGRRRFLREHHRFILGIPLVEFSADAAPSVVWEGSHEIMRTALREALSGLPCGQWRDTDLTECYHRARNTVFSACSRKEIHAEPGECFLIHRLALHGIAPWGDRARSAPDGRTVCFFRPDCASPADWLNEP